MSCVLVTGASRGIGLEFVRQYAASGYRVLATCRNPDASDDLRASRSGIDTYKLDIASEEDIERLARLGRGPAGRDLGASAPGVQPRTSSRRRRPWLRRTLARSLRGVSQAPSNASPMMTRTTDTGRRSTTANPLSAPDRRYHDRNSGSRR
jgi:NAD(P)-dependent dehydrogenase (short-subunit alcohol dehydrogenase family)